MLLGSGIAALAVHGRTHQQAYQGLANWEQIGQVAQLAKEINPQVLIIGNGDVKHRQQANQLAEQYQLAGVLIGRATWGNPFVFALVSEPQLSLPSLTKVALEHARSYEQSFQAWPKYSFLPMRKHLAWYIKGVPQAKEIRQQLVRTNCASEVERILLSYHLL
jgi:tRNA-dihydrouridine synthase B